MRICVFSERMAPPFDEGIRNLALHLGDALGEQHEVMLLTMLGRSVVARNLENVGGRGRIPAALLLSPALARRMRAFAPGLVFYIPTASATLFSVLRSRVLRWMGKGAPVVLLALQPRRFGVLARGLMPVLRPELALAQSESTCASLAALGYRVARFPPAIDLNRFRPASPERRSELRTRYAIDPRAFVILHVGHVNRRRNIQSLAALQRPGTQVIVVGSTSTPHDQSLAAELTAAGVRVVAEFVPEIAEIYRIADCYVFPVEQQSGAIDLPLSVFEALACGLPVVTTRYGGLPAHLAESQALRYIDGAHQVADATESVRGAQERLSRECISEIARSSVEPFAWSRTAAALVALVRAELGLDDASTQGGAHGR